MEQTRLWLLYIARRSSYFVEVKYIFTRSSLSCVSEPGVILLPVAVVALPYNGTLLVSWIFNNSRHWVNNCPVKSPDLYLYRNKKKHYNNYGKSQLTRTNAMGKKSSIWNLSQQIRWLRTWLTEPKLKTHRRVLDECVRARLVHVKNLKAEACRLWIWGWIWWYVSARDYVIPEIKNIHCNF
jgi:hypothetical protein